MSRVLHGVASLQTGFASWISVLTCFFRHLVRSQAPHFETFGSGGGVWDLTHVLISVSRLELPVNGAPNCAPPILNRACRIPYSVASPGCGGVTCAAGWGVPMGDCAQSSAAINQEMQVCVISPYDSCSHHHALSPRAARQAIATREQLPGVVLAQGYGLRFPLLDRSRVTKCACNVPAMCLQRACNASLLGEASRDVHCAGAGEAGAAKKTKGQRNTSVSGC